MASDDPLIKLTRQVAVALASVRLDLLLRKLAELNAVCAVNLLRDDLDLLLDGELKVVQELEVRLSLADADHSLGESAGTCTTLGPMVADYSSICTSSESLLPNELELRFGVGPDLAVKYTS